MKRNKLLLATCNHHLARKEMSIDLYRLTESGGIETHVMRINTM